MKAASVTIHERERKIELQVGDASYQMKKSKGWIYLLDLLRHPGQQRYALSLLAAHQSIPEQYRLLGEISESQRNSLDLYSCYYAPEIKMADQRTVTEVKARLLRLIEMESSLRIQNNLAALDDLLQEKEELEHYLKEIMNKSGQLRNFREHNRREIYSVYKAIRRCLDSIARLDPALGRYLEGRVKIWRYLSYEPGEIQIKVA